MEKIYDMINKDNPMDLRVLYTIFRQNHMFLFHSLFWVLENLQIPVFPEFRALFALRQSLGTWNPWQSIGLVIRWENLPETTVNR
jgi:hypothetical protein